MLSRVLYIIFGIEAAERPQGPQYKAYLFSGDRAAELYDSAGFEELQNNKEHALTLYKKIIEKYPDSPYAGKAEERTSLLRQKEMPLSKEQE